MRANPREQLTAMLQAMLPAGGAHVDVEGYGHADPACSRAEGAIRADSDGDWMTRLLEKPATPVCECLTRDVHPWTAHLLWAQATLPAVAPVESDHLWRRENVTATWLSVAPTDEVSAVTCTPCATDADGALTIQPAFVDLVNAARHDWVLANAPRRTGERTHMLWVPTSAVTANSEDAPAQLAFEHPWAGLCDDVYGLAAFPLPEADAQGLAEPLGGHVTARDQLSAAGWRVMAAVLTPRLESVESYGQGERFEAATMAQLPDLLATARAATT